LNNEKSRMYSYYKLKVYENIKEEFLHIDTDTKYLLYYKWHVAFIIKFHRNSRYNPGP